MKKLLTVASGVFITVAALPIYQPLQAQTLQTLPDPPQNCIYLKEVPSGEMVVRKVISLTNSNANTDFAVPTGTSFSNFNVKFVPENNSRYRIDVNLKYNDNSSSRPISRSIDAKRFDLYEHPFQLPTDRQPFQVNTRITGSRNTAYQVFVLACQ